MREYQPVLCLVVSSTHGTVDVFDNFYPWKCPNIEIHWTDELFGTFCMPTLSG